MKRITANKCARCGHAASSHEIEGGCSTMMITRPERAVNEYNAQHPENGGLREPRLCGCKRSRADVLRRVA